MVLLSPATFTLLTLVQAGLVLVNIGVGVYLAVRLRQVRKLSVALLALKRKMPVQRPKAPERPRPASDPTLGFRDPSR